MPVEIRELHIRIVVDAKPPAPPPSAGGGKPAPAAKGAGGDTDAIVAECVEQVLEILQARKDR